MDTVDSLTGSLPSSVAESPSSVAESPSSVAESPSSVAESPSSVELDVVAAGAVELARAAAVELADGPVGEHLGVHADGVGIVTHAFAAELPGYRGWYWAVTLVRPPDGEPTVAEVVLLPGEGALRPPPWVPWSERLQAGDLSPGDVLPPEPDDYRLTPAYLQSDDPQVEAVAFELGLGRVRVLSRPGRLDAAERWHDGDGGPDSPMAKQAPAHCGTCAFMLPLAGSLQAAFGVCANEFTETDGRVVTVDHGCGAHSESVVEVETVELGDVYDDAALDIEVNEPLAEAVAASASADGAVAALVSVDHSHANSAEATEIVGIAVADGDDAEVIGGSFAAEPVDPSSADSDQL